VKFFPTQHGASATSQAPDVSDLVEQSHQMVLSVRQSYGLARFQLGLLLLTVSEGELWRGKAESMALYLEDIRVNRSSARQLMAVAQKFIVEFKLSDPIIDALACCSITALYRASKIITTDNIAEVLSSLLTLHDRDVLQRFLEMEPGYDPSLPGAKLQGLVGRFYALPDDVRIDFLSRVVPGRRPTESRRSAQFTAVCER
jgi:hypothetical protein